ncbi:hypothetical protein FD754_007020 [Muntiacus muntjak]|uniref:Uncharacterized protein n=1 Tax=Muntiacus muntjak TaxID=9888 RepID=A0A5N3WMZ6_MUNMU|nr:hypothetical protein FD754_007020 [Muntiacus muntjak]
MVYSPFKTKMVACYDLDSTSGGEGGGTPARSRRKWFAFSRWRLPICICWRPPHCYIVLFPIFLILVVGSPRSRGVRGRGT